MSPLAFQGSGGERRNLEPEQLDLEDLLGLSRLSCLSSLERQLDEDTSTGERRTVRGKDSSSHSSQQERQTGVDFLNYFDILLRWRLPVSAASLRLSSSG